MPPRRSHASYVAAGKKAARTRKRNLNTPLPGSPKRHRQRSSRRGLRSTRARSPATRRRAVRR